MKRVRLVLMTCCLILSVFAIYSLVIRDNRSTKYVVINSATGEEQPASENVRTDRIVLIGSLSGVLAFALAIGLLIDFRIGRNKSNTEQALSSSLRDR